MKAVVIIGILLIIGVIIALAVNSAQHPCIKSHQITVHHAAYTSTSYHYFGRHSVGYPVYHAASNSMETVCDQHK